MIEPNDVREWLVSSTGAAAGVPSAEDEALLVRVIGAVEEHVAHGHTAPDPLGDDWEQAIVMQSARLWERRNTPTGIGGFGEFGAVRVTRLDPDVAELLAPYRIWSFA